MNIATSNVAPNTGLPAAASGTSQTNAGAPAAGADVSVDGASTNPGFGALMTIHLADGRVEHAMTNGNLRSAEEATDDTSAATDAKAVAAAGEPATLDATLALQPRALVVRSTALPTKPDASTPTAAAASASSTSTANGDAVRHDQSARDKVDDADDAAPQLAVISQWAAFAQPVASDGAAPASDAAVASTSLDTKPGKPGVGASTAGDAVAHGKEGGVIDADTRQGAMTPFSSTNDSMAPHDHRSPSSRGDQSVGPTTTDASTRAAAAKIANDAALAAHARTTTSDQGGSPSSTANATAAIGSLFAARLATAGSTSSTSTASSTTPTTVHETVGSGAWANEVGQVALKMTTADLQSASLRLNPEHLGPLDVQVRVDNGVTHVAFTAAHADTRQALEASRTTLDQMFGSQGIKMGDVSVGTATADPSSGRGPQADGAQADASRRDSGNRWSAGGTTDDADAVTTSVAARVSRAVGLVDTFA